MNKRAYKVLLLVTACGLVTFALTTALAQQSKETNVTFDQARRYSVKFERGDKITVDNRTTGRITVVGWDQDFIEATATSERGVEAVNVEVNNDSSGKRIFLKADYADYGDAELSRNPAEARQATLKARLRGLDARREAYQARLRGLDARREGFKARLAGIDADVNQQRQEERRKNVLLKIQELDTLRGDIQKDLADLETLRSEILKELAQLESPEPTPSPTPSPTPKVEATPGISTAETIPNTIKPPADTMKPPVYSLKPPIQSPPLPPYSGGRPAEVDLEVKVPRYAEIELIRVSRSKVEVTGIETPLIISGDKSTIKLSQVGAVEVKTSSGNVEIEDAAGLVDVITVSGAIKVRRAGSDVRALSIGGLVDVQCARGRVDVSTTDGAIKLIGIGGDVDATTTNSEVRFTGAIREDGRYHLKSMSGYVEMTVLANPPGFTAALSSYKGMVSTSFLLKIKQPSPPDPLDVSVPPPFSRRLIGRYGNGRAQITLDSFDGVVLLSKALPGKVNECR